MGKSAILAIRIIGDATGAVTALEKVDGSAASMESTMNKASAGAALALGGLVAVAVGAGNAASDLEQATGAVDSVFGTYADKVHEYAQTAATDVGLAKAEYEGLSSVLGAQLKNMGIDMDNVSSQSADLIGLGSDLAATFGGTTSDAVGALSSLLRGERDPIERYGVSIKQVDINAKLAQMGLDGLEGEAAKSAETQATLALLMEQTADASGQFARESDTAAGAQQRANAMWTDAQAALGEQLLPIMAEGATMLSELAKWAAENSEVVTILAVVIGGLAAGILILNGAMKAYAAVQALSTAATWAGNAAWLANPVTWIVLAIVAAIALAVAITVLIVENWEELSRIAADVWGGIIGWIEDAYNWLMQLVSSAIPGWMSDLMGFQTFSARMVVEEPTFGPATMAFSADEAMAGFGYNTAAAPTAFTAPAPTLGGGNSSSAAQIVNNEYNIRVDGALDPEAVAAQIERLLNRRNRLNGSFAAAGGTR